MDPLRALATWALTLALVGPFAYLLLGWRGVGIAAASAALGLAGYALGGWRGALLALVAVTLLVLLG